MKYCSKCGSELLDEAVICPKCGCPADNGKSTNKSTAVGSKVKSALVLNIIAFVIALFTILNFAFSLGNPDNQGTVNSYILVFTILALASLSFILCIANVFAARNGHANSVFAWIYFISVIVTTILYALLAPVIFIATICGFGILLPVPPILQIIAGIRLIQATKE